MGSFSAFSAVYPFPESLRASCPSGSFCYVLSFPFSLFSEPRPWRKKKKKI